MKNVSRQIVYGLFPKKTVEEYKRLNLIDSDRRDMEYSHTMTWFVLFYNKHRHMFVKRMPTKSFSTDDIFSFSMDDIFLMMDKQRTVNLPVIFLIIKNSLIEKKMEG